MSFVFLLICFFWFLATVISIALRRSGAGRWVFAIPYAFLLLLVPLAISLGNEPFAVVVFYVGMTAVLQWVFNRYWDQLGDFDF